MTALPTRFPLMLTLTCCAAVATVDLAAAADVQEEFVVASASSDADSDPRDDAASDGTESAEVQGLSVRLGGGMGANPDVGPTGAVSASLVYRGALGLGVGSYAAAFGGSGDGEGNEADTNATSLQTAYIVGGHYGGFVSWIGLSPKIAPLIEVGVGHGEVSISPAGTHSVFTGQGLFASARVGLISRDLGYSVALRSDLPTFAVSNEYGTEFEGFAGTLTAEFSLHFDL